MACEINAKVNDLMDGEKQINKIVSFEQLNIISKS